MKGIHDLSLSSWCKLSFASSRKTIIDLVLFTICVEYHRDFGFYGNLVVQIISSSSFVAIVVVFECLKLTKILFMRDIFNSAWAMLLLMLLLFSHYHLLSCLSCTAISSSPFQPTNRVQLYLLITNLGYINNTGCTTPCRPCSCSLLGRIQKSDHGKNKI